MSHAVDGVFAAVPPPTVSCSPHAPHKARVIVVCEALGSKAPPGARCRAVTAFQREILDSGEPAGACRRFATAPDALFDSRRSRARRGRVAATSRSVSGLIRDDRQSPATPAHMQCSRGVAPGGLGASARRPPAQAVRPASRRAVPPPRRCAVTARADGGKGAASSEAKAEPAGGNGGGAPAAGTQVKSPSPAPYVATPFSSGRVGGSGDGEPRARPPRGPHAAARPRAPCRPHPPRTAPLPRSPARRQLRRASAPMSAPPGTNHWRHSRAAARSPPAPVQGSW